MLRNQDFGEPYTALSTHGNIITAAEWVPSWREGNIEWSEDLPFEDGANPAGRPEFKPLPKSLFPERVLEGDFSQCWFTVWRPHIGGVCQYDIPVPQGRTLKLSFMVQAWCSDFEEPYKKSEGEMYAGLLIKHGGGRRWDPGWIFYPQWTPIGIPWISLEWEFVADQPLLSVGVESWGGKWPKKHNDFIVSHARLEVQGEPAPDPGPSPEPPSSDEILETKIWFVERQLDAAENDAAAADGTVAYWRTILADLQQPSLLTRTTEHFSSWLKKLLV